MANPTTNFGWVMPTSTSLVTNLPADFNTFGQGVDTSLQYLLGGTTGQVLSKTSNTNMAFTWVTPTDQTPLTTKGDLFAFSTVDARLPAGANETRLVADSAQTLGLKYVADTTNYAINAKGDLLAGTAADTLAALTVGANNTVLTADSSTSTGLKWATPTATGFVGCSVYKSAAQSISNATSTNLTFDSETFDTDAFHSTTVNTSRMTIPTGKGGKYLVNVIVGFASNTTGIRSLELLKNGTTLTNLIQISPCLSGSTFMPSSYIANLSAADYLELGVYQTSGGALNVNAGADFTSFSVTYLGA